MADDKLIEAMARAISMAIGGRAKNAWYEPEARAAIRAINESGYRVVPVEPTEAMLIAHNQLMMDACARLLESNDGKWRSCYSRQFCRAVYCIQTFVARIAVH